MDHLMRLRDVVINYISPTAKRQRILESYKTSPDYKAHHFLSPDSGYVDKKGDTAMLRLAYEKLELSSATTNLKKRSRDEFERTESSSFDNSSFDSSSNTRDSSEPPGIKLEVDEEMHNMPPEMCPNSTYTPFIKEELDSESEPDPENLTGFGALERDEVTAKVQEYLDRQAELEDIKDDIAKFKASGDWHPHEIYLFERLSLRSFEVILPKSWRIDFPTLPHSIFAENDADETIFNTNYTSYFHGVKALQSLLNLGVRVRDNVLTHAPTEKLIIKEINNYTKWSERDGGYVKMRYIPVLATIAARPKQTIDSLSSAIDGKMRALAEEYRIAYTNPQELHEGGHEYGEIENYIRRPPLLYGIIVAQTIVILVTLDSSNPDATIRHMQHFDFTEKGTDAWIGLAIAMTVIVARNYIMSIKDELEIETQPESDVDL
ncbi:hypothetical protein K3495_g1634 [Podosphaera aphanis]|nr:hypothetical protein K3495_g1634 [Podosphaera aphanis]